MPSAVRPETARQTASGLVSAPASIRKREAAFVAVCCLDGFGGAGQPLRL